MSDVTVLSEHADACKKRAEAIISERKGKDPRKADKKPFVDAWVGMAKETGLTEEAAQLLLDGVGFAGATPLYRLATETSDDNVYKKFLMTKCAMDNRGGITLRILLSLFALGLMDTSGTSLPNFVARRISGFSKKRDGKQFDVEKPVKLEMVNPLANDSISESADIAAQQARTMLSLIKPSLESLIDGGKLNKPRMSAAQSLLGWLEEHAVMSMPIEDEELPGEGEVSPNPQPERTPSEDLPQSTPKEQDEPTAEKPADASEAQAHKKDKTKTVRDKLKQAQEAQKEAEAQVEMLRSLLNKTQRENEELKASRLALGDHYGTLQQKLEQITRENESLSKDLATAEEMLTMLEERDAHKADVADQKMVRDLKFEYEDWRDSLDREMTTNLGLNLRDQLGNVFEILISHGIELD